MRISATIATSLAMLAAVIATPAAAAIVNVSSANSTGTTINLAAGTYTVNLAGIADGGTYDGWSPWTFSGGCTGGMNCTTGYLNAFAIDFGHGTDSFDGVDAFQFGFVAEPGNSGLYETAAQGLAAYRTLAYSYAPLPIATLPSSYTLAPSPYTFTLATAQQVKFFIFDSNYGDNRDGISLSVVSNAVGAVPEPATWAMMIAGFGMAGGALRRRRTRHLRFA